jgi:hypothetical protein
VRVSEAHPLFRETVDIRCLELRTLAIALRLAIAHVIEEYKDDIWLCCFSGMQARSSSQKGE